MTYEITEKQVKRIRKNHFVFRVGTLLAIFGLLIMNLGEMSIYSGSTLLYYVPAIVPWYIGVSLCLVGFVFILISTVIFYNEIYENNSSKQ